MAVLLWSVITIIITVIAIMTDIVVFNIAWLLSSAEIRNSLLHWCLYEHTT